MKQFKYNLETVLNYKTQVLDNLRTEHAVMLEKVNRKQKEIEYLKLELAEYRKSFNQAKSAGAPIEKFRLFDICIGRMEDIIAREKKELSFLKSREASKKIEVISARMDTSKFEKLRDKRLQAYQKAEVKEEEGNAEEFIVRAITRSRYQNR